MLKRSPKRGPWQTKRRLSAPTYPPESITAATFVFRSNVFTYRPQPIPLNVGFVSGRIPFVPSPFAQYDWPNPQRSRPAHQDWSNALELLLLGQDTQFAGPGMWADYDWPNPQRPRPIHQDWSNALEILLLGQDTQFAGPGLWVDYDYPNPTVPPASVTLLTWVNAGRITEAVAAAPFAQLDWPNPIRSLFSAINRTIAVGLRPLPVPFALYDWPVPMGAIPSNALKTWVDSYKLELIGRDLLPFSQDDWPNPARVPARQDQWVQSLLSTLLSVVVQMPFAQADWPNPRAALAALTLRTWLDSYKLTLIGQDALPFRQVDWLVPQRVGLRQDQWVQNVLSNLLVALVPFFQTEWPNPFIAPRAEALKTWLDAVKLNLLGQDVLPFRQGDWPLPGIAPVRQDQWLQNLVKLFAVPFAQLDWPNPILRLGLRPDQWIQELVATTLGVTPPPFAQLGWPNPEGPKATTELRTFLNQVALNLLGRDVFFGVAGQGVSYDWPNPRHPLILRPDYWTQNLLATVLAPIITPAPPVLGLYDVPPRHIIIGA